MNRMWSVSIFLIFQLFRRWLWQLGGYFGRILVRLLTLNKKLDGTTISVVTLSYSI